jgi:hypothetical protein
MHLSVSVHTHTHTHKHEVREQGFYCGRWRRALFRVPCMRWCARLPSLCMLLICMFACARAPYTRVLVYTRVRSSFCAASPTWAVTRARRLRDAGGDRRARGAASRAHTLGLNSREFLLPPFRILSDGLRLCRKREGLDGGRQGGRYEGNVRGRYLRAPARALTHPRTRPHTGSGQARGQVSDEWQ